MEIVASLNIAYTVYIHVFIMILTINTSYFPAKPIIDWSLCLRLSGFTTRYGMNNVHLLVSVTETTFFVGFFGPRANVELLHRLHVALHASNKFS
jgi:hypothetical protein